MELNVQAQETGNNKRVIIGIVIAALIVGGILFWYFRLRTAVLSTPPSALQPGVEPTSLGAEVYEKANNPIEDRLPSTVTSVPNPIEDVYKNPFQ